MSPFIFITFIPAKMVGCLCNNAHVSFERPVRKDGFFLFYFLLRVKKQVSKLLSGKLKSVGQEKEIYLFYCTFLLVQKSTKKGLS